MQKTKTRYGADVLSPEASEEIAALEAQKFEGTGLTGAKAKHNKQIDRQIRQVEERDRAKNAAAIQTEGARLASDQADIQIAALESQKTGDETRDKLIDRQVNRVKYQKAVYDYQEALGNSGVLNAKTQEAYKIWQDSVKSGASGDEQRQNFEEFQKLQQQSTNAQKGLFQALGNVNQAKQEAIKGKFERKESFSTGTFSAFEAMDSHNDWQKENTIKQTEFLKKICENTELGLWS